GGVGDLGVETNNLLVYRRAVASGLAPEDEEDRLAGPPGLGLRGGVVGVPAEPRRVELAGLGAGRRGQEQHGGGRENPMHQRYLLRAECRAAAGGVTSSRRPS